MRGQAAGTFTALIGSLAATVLLAMPLTASAYQWEKGDFSFRIDSRISIGAAWRLEERDHDLLGKLNVPGQEHLCDGDDCLSLNGDPAPNQRLVDAEGGFIAANYDNGDLNYDKGDIVAAVGRYTFETKSEWKRFKINFSGILLTDPVNDDFLNHSGNTRFMPAYTPRSDASENYVGNRFYLLNGFLSFPIDIGDKTLHISVGEQVIRWGESTFTALGAISVLNPPDQQFLYQPGAKLKEIFQPVGMVSLSMSVTENLFAQLIYQYEWKRAIPAAAGSFWSTIDIAGGGEYAIISLGQFPDDPNQIGSLQGLAALVTGTSTTVRLLPSNFGAPKDGGQYGLKLSGYLPNFNNGTEWGLYYLNYHSRLPYGSLYATDASCARDSANIATALVDCGGFNGLRPQLIAGLGAAVPALQPVLDQIIAAVLPQKEPIPIDTLKVFLDYPEDIHLFGVSFNTNVGLWSIAGEVAYRPNLPLQVSLSDVLFAGLQPAFPRQDIVIPALATLPSSRHAAPDFLETRYRGHEVQPNQLIRGYERMKVAQLDLTGLRSFSASNPFKADQIILLLELGATQVFDMPSTKELQFESGDANASHASPGADGTGQPGGVPDTRTFNPTQQTENFADDFSWGVRSLAQFHYADALFGWNLIPTVAINYDITGIAPFPVQNFIEGRLEYAVGSEIEFSQALSMVLMYHGWSGGGTVNKLKDRDFASFSMAYNF